MQSGSLPGYPSFAGYAHLALAAAVSRIVFAPRHVHPLFALLLVFAVLKRDRARRTSFYTGAAHDTVVVHSCIRSLVRGDLLVRYDASIWHIQIILVLSAACHFIYEFLSVDRTIGSAILLTSVSYSSSVMSERVYLSSSKSMSSSTCVYELRTNDPFSSGIIPFQRLEA